MKTKIEWDLDILNIINKIHQEFPELSKYIDERPFEDSDNDGININNLKDYHDSLQKLIDTYAKTHAGDISKKNNETTLFPGYPQYPPSDDIYQRFSEESNINPEDISQQKTTVDKEESWNEKVFEEDMSGADLDIPGSELDDEQESIGSEDEENNYYSLGGDNHNDLEENKG